jgi:hypothetical protein
MIVRSDQCYRILRDELARHTCQARGRWQSTAILVSELGNEGHGLVVGGTRDDLASKRRLEKLPSCRYPLY